MTARSTHAAAALASVLISLTTFHGVATLAAPRHAAAHGQVPAVQTPPAAGGDVIVLLP